MTNSLLPECEADTETGFKTRYFTLLLPVRLLSFLFRWWMCSIFTSRAFFCGLFVVINLALPLSRSDFFFGRDLHLRNMDLLRFLHDPSLTSHFFISVIRWLTFLVWLFPLDVLTIFCVSLILFAFSLRLAHFSSSLFSLCVAFCGGFVMDDKAE